MKFKLHCMASQLADALAAASTVTDHGVKVPILKAMRIEVENGTAVFISTNTDQTVRSSIAADGEGLIHLDTLALAAKVRALSPMKPMAIEGDEVAVFITQGRTRWKLPAIYNSGFDFIKAADRIEGEAVKIPFDQLSAALRAVQPAMATDDTRWYLTGPHIEWTGGHLIAVATDGYLLHAVQLPGEWPERESILMPGESINAITKLFRPGAQLDLISEPNGFTLDDGDTLFRSKVIEGNFPDWRRVVPKSGGAILLDCAEFIKALERVAAIREDEGKSARFVEVRLGISGDEITLTTKNKDGEEGADFCSCERERGEDHAVRVSASLILAALRSFGATDTIRLEYGSEIARKDGKPSPIVIHRAVSETEDFRLVNPLLGE